MTTAQLQTLEAQVLRWIEAAHPVSTTELLDKHRHESSSLSGETLRRAVWNLVDRGLVQYDYSWRLSPTGSRHLTQRANGSPKVKGA